MKEQVGEEVQKLLIHKALPWICSAIFGAPLLTAEGREFVFAKLCILLPIWVIIVLLLIVLLLSIQTFRHLLKRERNKLIDYSTKIKRWRDFVEIFDFETKQFGDTTVYAELRPFMDKRTLDIFENSFVFHAIGKRGDSLQKQAISDLIVSIEKQWKIL